MTSRRWMSVVAAVAGAALVVTLVVVVAGADSPPSAREALARAKRFADQAESVEYRGTSRFEFHDPAFPEEDFSEKSTFEESAVFPDRSRSLVEYEGSISESVAIDDVTYDRSSADRESLEDDLWTKYDPDAGEAGEDGELFSFTGFSVGGLSVAPAELPALIDEARRPRILSQSDGRTIIRTQVETSEFEELYFPRLELDLVVENDGRVTALRLEGSDEYETDRTQVEIERWNHDVRIEVPPDADIDPTPNLDEEDIAAYDDAELLQPRSIPTGWMLQSATVISAGDFGLGEEALACDQVNLYFVNEESFDEFDDEDVPLGAFYLDLFEFPTSCSEDRPREADDFTAGPYTGWIEDEEGYLYGQVTVGDTVVEFDTDLREEDLAVILGDLVPLDLANPPAATLALD